MIYHFKIDNTNDNRAILKCSVNDKHLLSKISVIYDRRDNKMETIGCFDGHYIENHIYNDISIKHKCDLLPTCIFIYDKTSERCIKFIHNNDEYIINYSSWTKKLERHYGYSIFVVETDPEYDILFNKIHKYPTYRAENIFVRIMTHMLYLNKKYNFGHGDLKTDNILINNNDDIKFIDFDLSTIGDLYSNNQYNFIGAEIIIGMNTTKGFLFDFYRLYTSIYIGNSCTLFENNKLFQSINKIFNRILLIYKNNTKKDCLSNIFNNVEYFGEWLLEPEVTYDNILLFLDTYQFTDNTSSDSDTTDHSEQDVEYNNTDIDNFDGTKQPELYDVPDAYISSDDDESEYNIVSILDIKLTDDDISKIVESDRI